MLGYVTLGTNDLERAAVFYDAIAKEMGVGRMMEFDSFIAWGEMGGAPGFAATKPFDGKAATSGNGTMVALEAKDRDHVQRIYDAALANGGSDEGAPGPRGEPDPTGVVFYAAYFRDPDGNKFNAFLMDKVS
ncbi:VOC family protein [Qipengyuania marisflavi]|uniref:VOC family protein n=1 Tax=Qipengyuania marisflavi TaxID=2486356 RepID=A0A5S3P6D0_9SPHN|nr:VOC family protein [Qipengyuania marisflavi]TMM48381.1 VOC family protein [Qipengyuania marisflavi]